MYSPFTNTLRAVLDPHTLLGLVCYSFIGLVSTVLINCYWLQEIRFDLSAFSPVSHSKGFHTPYTTEHFVSLICEFE